MTRLKAGIVALAVAALVSLMVASAAFAGEPDVPAGRTSGEPDQPLGGRTSGDPDSGDGARVPDAGEPDAPATGEPDVGGGKIPGSVPETHPALRLILWIGDLLVLPRP